MRYLSFATRYAIILLAAALLLAPSAWAQSAPIPSQLLTAKTAFLSNGGSTSPLVTSADLYSGMYSALRIWGRYLLVNTPEEADLIFVVTFSTPSTDVTDGNSFRRPTLTVTVQDAKSHVALWTESEYSFPNAKKGNEKAYDNVIGEIRALTEAKHIDKAAEAAKAPAAAPEAKADVKADAPAPAADSKPVSKKDAKKDAKKDDDTKKSHRIW